MNKQVIKLLSLILVCSAALQADSDTDLTFVSIGGQRNGAERAMLTQRIAMRKDKGIGGTFQAVPFFKQSCGARFAELFSPVGKQTTSLGSADTTSPALVPDVVIDPQIYGGAGVNASLKLSPKHRELGVHLAWQQRLDVLLEGLFFELDAPIVNVRHELNPVYTGAQAAQLQASIEGTSGDVEHFKTYQGYQSKTGVADVALRLGYNFLEEEAYRLAVNLAVVAPTGGKPTSDFMFKPVVGDNNAWAAGAGVTLTGKLYENADHELRGVAELNYRYRFANTQERTLGLKGVNGSQFGVYYNVDTDNAAAEGALADKLTTDLKVTGGSAVNLLAGLGYDYKGFSADVSYELNGWASESVELAASSNFVENPLFVFGAGTGAGSPLYAAGTKLLKANLDYAPATNPSKLNHKVGGALGYTLWHDQEYPVALGAGGSYTFASNRAAFQGWGVFGKVGVSF